VSYRDYRDGGHKTLVLQAGELLRRFLLHVLPKGLMRVRHYGLLANRCRVQRLAHIRKLLGAPAPEPERKKSEPFNTKRTLTPDFFCLFSDTLSP